MTTITAVYEHGKLRPIEPLDLPDGAEVEIVIIQRSSPQRTMPENRKRTPAELLDEVAALPLEGEPNPHLARDHDAILYPKHGK